MTFTCFIDEAGCPGRLSSRTAEIQPFLVIAGVCLRSADDTTFTRQFTALKHKYVLSRDPLGAAAVTLTHEIKGCELRAQMRKEPQGTGPAHVLLNDLLRLLKQFDAHLFAHIAPKPPGEKFDGRSIYAAAMEYLARDFHRLLELQCADGLIVADFREPQLNALMTRPIAQAKYLSRDELPHLIGVPSFGHSESHAGLQVADLLASALLFPAVSTRHARSLPEHPHLHPHDAQIAHRFRQRLLALQAPTWALPQRGTPDARLYSLATLLATQGPLQ
jgi:hypothetical protein